MTDIAKKRLEKALETLYAGVGDTSKNRLVNDIAPVMEALQAYNGDNHPAMVMLEETLADLEAAKLSVLSSTVGLGTPGKEFFDNLDFAEKKMVSASKYIATLREAGKRKQARL